MREGVFSGTIVWGPNQLAGIVNESFLTGYKVTVVDKCGLPLRLAGDEESALYLPKSQGTFEPSCCAGDAYSAMWNLTLPEGYSHFMIVAYSDVWGDQDAGALIEIVDAVNGSSAASVGSSGQLPTRGAVSSGTQRMFAAPIVVVLVSLAKWLLSVG